MRLIHSTATPINACWRALNWLSNFDMEVFLVGERSPKVFCGVSPRLEKDATSELQALRHVGMLDDEPRDSDHDQGSDHPRLRWRLPQRIQQKPWQGSRGYSCKAKPLMHKGISIIRRRLCPCVKSKCVTQVIAQAELQSRGWPIRSVGLWRYKIKPPPISSRRWRFLKNDVSAQ